MRASVKTGAIVGAEAVPVDVEAHVAPGLPCFTIVGLGDTAVHEARERVRSAIKAAGFEFPMARVVLNLAPAPIRKRGTGFDLPAAAAILAATGQLDRAALRGRTLVGELSLDGDVRPVHGLLVHAVLVSSTGGSLVGPADGSCGARTVLERAYLPITSLRCLLEPLEPHAADGSLTPQAPVTYPDIGDVVGQAHARRAVEIAAAGGHNLLLEGPPGAGKTLLAHAMAGVLPALDPRERVETALVHSLGGLDEHAAMSGARPFRAPHHASTKVGLVGGGTPVRPGEASLAHNGVLFLDEMSEFAPSVLQTLRQPMEDGSIRLVRADGVAEFPARFTLVGAVNPCPCGFFGDDTDRCACTASVVERYRMRIGGPLRDRIDLVVRVAAVPPAKLVSGEASDSSAEVAGRVLAARRFSAHRRRERNGPCGPITRDLAADASTTLVACATTTRVSARGMARAVRVARTIADLEGAADVAAEHVLEAFTFRG